MASLFKSRAKCILDSSFLHKIAVPSSFMLETCAIVISIYFDFVLELRTDVLHDFSQHYRLSFLYLEN